MFYPRACGAAALLVMGCGRSAPPPSAPSPLLAKDVPAFERRTMAGEAFNPAAQQGKIVVLKFFAKYCEPCKRTLPAAERLHEERPDVLLVGISEDEHGSDIDEVVAQYHLTFPVIHDRGNVLAGRFRVSDLPVTFVIAADHKIRWVGGPDQGEDDLQAAVDAFRP